MYRKDGTLRENYQRVMDEIKNKDVVAISLNSKKEKVFNQLKNEFNIETVAMYQIHWLDEIVIHHKVIKS